MRPPGATPAFSTPRPRFGENVAPKLDAPLLFAAPALAGFGSLTLTVFWLLNVVLVVVVVVVLVVVGKVTVGVNVAGILPHNVGSVGLKVLWLFGLGDKALDCGVEAHEYGDDNCLVKYGLVNGIGDGLVNGGSSSAAVANSNGDGGGNESFWGFDGGCGDCGSCCCGGAF